MALPADDYKSMDELAEYARKRALISAARGGHQEFAYWLRIMRVAQDYDRRGLMQSSAQIGEELSACIGILEYPDEHELSIDERVQIYAEAVHYRKLLRNRGQPAERLSLDWLRAAAGLLEIEEDDDGNG